MFGGVQSDDNSNGYSSGMQNFIKHFAREPDGSWVCLSFAEISTFMGRIQVKTGSRFHPGTVFMGVDICKLLDEGGAVVTRPLFNLRDGGKGAYSENI